MPVDPILSVGEFISLVNQTLDFAYPRVKIEGEVSSFSPWRDRLAFFDLKDEEATINCMIALDQLHTPLEDGMKIQVEAAAKVTNKGRFSIRVLDYQLSGEGALKRAFEILKAKLESEGLFAPERKRQLPTYPHAIGLVTATGSAAYHDFMKIISARWGGVTIKVADVQVQGRGAIEQIVGAINHFNQLQTLPDVLVVIRGGGSLEDLMAFNSEPVARAIATSRTPTLVGVGHEVDTSLADLAADVRAVTPTDAAKLAVPDKAEVQMRLIHQQQALQNGIREVLTKLQNQLIDHSYHLQQFIKLPQQRFLEATHHLDRAAGGLVHNLKTQQQRLGEYHSWLGGAVQQLLSLKKQQLQTLSRSLGNLDPRRVLARGYAVIRAAGKLVRSGGDVELGQLLVLQLAEDQISAEVRKVKRGSE